MRKTDENQVSGKTVVMLTNDMIARLRGILRMKSGEKW